MPGAAKAMAICTVACLVAVVGYSVALGSSGWLWFGWVVLGMCTAGVTAIGPSAEGGSGARRGRRG